MFATADTEDQGEGVPSILHSATADSNSPSEGEEVIGIPGTLHSVVGAGGDGVTEETPPYSVSLLSSSGGESSSFFLVISSLVYSRSVPSMECTIPFIGTSTGGTGEVNGVAPGVEDNDDDDSDSIPLNEVLSETEDCLSCSIFLLFSK